MAKHFDPDIHSWPDDAQIRDEAERAADRQREQDEASIEPRTVVLAPGTRYQAIRDDGERSKTLTVRRPTSFEPSTLNEKLAAMGYGTLLRGGQRWFICLIDR